MLQAATVLHTHVNGSLACCGFSDQIVKLLVRDIDELKGSLGSMQILPVKYVTFADGNPLQSQRSFGGEPSQAGLLSIFCCTASALFCHKIRIDMPPESHASASQASRSDSEMHFLISGLKWNRSASAGQAKIGALQIGFGIFSRVVTEAYQQLP